MKKSNLTTKNKNFDLASFMNGNGRIYLMLIISAFALFLTVVGFDTLDELKYNYDVYNTRKYGYSFSNCFSMEYSFIVFISALLGAASFQFLTSKQQGITMLALPVKRSKLFNQKVILPICGLAVVVIMVKAVMIYCNTKIYGVNSDLILQGITDIVVCLKYVLLGFTAFCVSSVACGKKLEVVFGGVSLIGVMPIVYKLVDSLLDMYLYGYDSIFYSVKYYSDFVFILNPARELSISDYFEEIRAFGIEKLIVSAFWIVALILTLVFTKRYFIKGYKAEKIEMKSANKPMLAIIGAAMALTVAQIVLNIIATEFEYQDVELSSIIYLILLCVLTVVFAFLTICLIETSFRLNKNKLIAVLSPLSVVALILVFAFTGGLGYESRMPDTNDIKSIEISTTFYGSDMFNTMTSPDLYSGFPEQATTFTTEKDFKVIKGIHETTLENRDMDTAESICITYVLKDGSTICRNYYDLSEETTAKLLMLWKTDATKKDIEDYLLNNKPTNFYLYEEDSYYNSDDYYVDYWGPYEEAYSVFNYDQNEIYIASKQNTETKIKNKITKAEFTLIKEAIYKDYCELTAIEWFKPTKTYGAVVLMYNDEYYVDYYGDYLYEEDEVLYESDTAEITIENEAPPVNENATDELTAWGGFSGLNEQVTIPVTAEMKNTVAVLKSLGLYQYLTDNKAEIERVFIADAKEYFEWKCEWAIGNELHFGIYEPSAYFVPDIDLENDVLFFGEEGGSNPVKNYFGDGYYSELEDYYGSVVDDLDYSDAPVKEIKNSKEMYTLLTKAHIKYYDEELKGKILFVDYRDGIDNAYYIPA